jgi:hypothetical protein
MNQLFKKGLALGAASFLAFQTAQAAQVADVIFVVDESGSMSGEHAWLSGMISSLEAGLQTKGVTSNQYGLVGFGAISPAPTKKDMDNGTAGVQEWGTSTQFSSAASNLVTTGGFEDGWSAINFALNSYTFRPNAALNIILVTDEDRDVTSGSTLNYNNMLTSLNGRNAMLNVVVNAGLRGDLNQVGVGATADSAFIANGVGGYNTVSGTNVMSPFGTTKGDYIDLAWATGGAAWDLNILRSGGNNAVSFTNAFVDVKVQEIKDQEPSVPEPATMGLMGLGLLALAAFRRRKSA